MFRDINGYTFLHFFFQVGRLIAEYILNYEILRVIIIVFSRFSIMSECWSEKPEERPTFKWICTAVNRLIKDTKVETVTPSFHWHLLLTMLLP